MPNYGGMGGLVYGRELNTDDPFEMAVEQSLGDRLRADGDACAAMWSALSNMEWVRQNGDTASYTFRAAGDLIAAIRGSGNYLDWYCSGPDATVSDEIEQALATEGWYPRKL